MDRGEDAAVAGTATLRTTRNVKLVFLTNGLKGKGGYGF